LRQGNRKEQTEQQKSQDSFVHLATQPIEQPTFYNYVEASSQPETLQDHSGKRIIENPGVRAVSSRR
jgi:hypothetical protein